MKVLVTGVRGQLGFDVVGELKRRGHEAIGIDVAELDITDGEAVASFIGNVRPEAIVHCAAWTAVDAAEDEENIEKVRAVNAKGTEYIARAAKNVGAKLVYISTDYVFGGAGERPWEPDDERAPLNIYGQTKYEGELAVEEALDEYFIVRISWVFGVNGKNFIRTMLALSQKYEALRVVNDQIGLPTYTYDLARLLVDMIETDKYGRYHATNEGEYISWADFANEIFSAAGKSVSVTPVTTAEYGVSKAKRPFNSRMSREKLSENGFALLPDWKDALRRYLMEIEY
jgi:dTDP-4-dehydrorhamnose reductase